MQDEDWDIDSVSSDKSIASVMPEKEVSIVDEAKYVVFKSCLDELLKHCLTCEGPVVTTNESTRGCILTIKSSCVNDHECAWSSQPLIKNVPAGNVLMSASILFSGNTFAKISQLASLMNLRFLSTSSFFSIQNNYLFSVLTTAWEEEKQRVISDLKQKGHANLVGDGRCDSPGHNAKYGTYTIMTEEGKVATFSLVQVTEVTSSKAMEKEGFERCFKEISDGGVVVKRVTTDRHPSIACAMD